MGFFRKRRRFVAIISLISIIGSSACKNINQEDKIKLKQAESEIINSLKNEEFDKDYRVAVNKFTNIVNRISDLKNNSAVKKQNLKNGINLIRVVYTMFDEVENLLKESRDGYLEAKYDYSMRLLHDCIYKMGWIESNILDSENLLGIRLEVEREMYLELSKNLLLWIKQYLDEILKSNRIFPPKNQILSTDYIKVKEWRESWAISLNDYKQKLEKSKIK